MPGLLLQDNQTGTEEEDLSPQGTGTRSPAPPSSSQRPEGAQQSPPPEAESTSEQSRGFWDQLEWDAPYRQAIISIIYGRFTYSERAADLYRILEETGTSSLISHQASGGSLSGSNEPVTHEDPSLIRPGTPSSPRRITLCLVQLGETFVWQTLEECRDLTSPPTMRWSITREDDGRMTYLPAYLNENGGTVHHSGGSTPAPDQH